MTYIKQIMVFLFLSILPIFAVEADDTVVKEIKEKLEVLGSSNSFSFVHLDLSPSEVASLDALTIKTSAKFDQFGKLESLDARLAKFLKGIGNNNPETITQCVSIISRLAHQMMAATNKNSAWVSVRASLPDASFDMNRWHLDGADPTVLLYPKLTYKFAASLKGPSTYLYELSSDERDVFLANFTDRSFLNAFVDIKKAQSASKDQGVLFIVGDNAKAALHSEPKFDESRLFLSIVADDALEIEDLYERRYLQYLGGDERSWEEANIDIDVSGPEFTHEFWAKKYDVQYSQLGKKLEEFVLQKDQAFILLETLKATSSMPTLITLYQNKITNSAGGIDVEAVVGLLQSAMPTRNEFGGFAPIRAIVQHMECLNQTLTRKIQELKGLVSDLDSL